MINSMNAGIYIVRIIVPPGDGSAELQKDRNVRESESVANVPER